MTTPTDVLGRKLDPCTAALLCTKYTQEVKPGPDQGQESIADQRTGPRIDKTMNDVLTKYCL